MNLILVSSFLPLDGEALFGKQVLDDFEALFHLQTLQLVCIIAGEVFCDLPEQAAYDGLGHAFFHLGQQPRREPQVPGWEAFHASFGELVYEARPPNSVSFLLTLDHALQLEACQVMADRDGVDSHRFRHLVDGPTWLPEQGLKYPIARAFHVFLLGTGSKTTPFHKQSILSACLAVNILDKYHKYPCVGIRRRFC